MDNNSFKEMQEKVKRANELQTRIEQLQDRNTKLLRAGANYPMTLDYQSIRPDLPSGIMYASVSLDLSENLNSQIISLIMVCLSTEISNLEKEFKNL